MIRREVSDGQGQSQGRPGQEGHAQEVEQGSQGAVAFPTEPIYESLRRGREWVFVPTCIICQRTEDEHGDDTRHTFTPEGVRVDTAQFGPKRTDRRGPSDERGRRIQMTHNASETLFDPVLRQALIDKGILTPQDIEDAARKVQLITQAVTGQGHPKPQMWRGETERGGQ